MHVDAPTIDRDVLAISGDQTLGTVNLRDEFDATKLVRLPAAVHNSRPSPEGECTCEDPPDVGCDTRAHGPRVEKLAICARISLRSR